MGFIPPLSQGCLRVSEHNGPNGNWNPGSLIKKKNNNNSEPLKPDEEDFECEDCIPPNITIIYALITYKFNIQNSAFLPVLGH